MGRPIAIRGISACRVVGPVDQVGEALGYTAVEAEGGIAGHAGYRRPMRNRAVKAFVVDDVIESA